jgi:hypothetical protein
VYSPQVHLPGFVTLLAATIGIVLVLRALPPDPFGGDEGRKLPAAEGANSQQSAPEGFDRRRFLGTTVVMVE